MDCAYRQNAQLRIYVRIHSNKFFADHKRFTHEIHMHVVDLGQSWEEVTLKKLLSTLPTTCRVVGLPLS